MYTRTWVPPKDPKPSPTDNIRCHRRTNAVQIKKYHHLFSPTAQEGASSDESTEIMQRKEKNGEGRPFRLGDLPAEMYAMVFDLAYDAYLLKSHAIRSLPTPAVTRVFNDARKFFLMNNIFCLSTEAIPIYQKRCRRFMRKVKPEGSQDTLDMLEYLSDTDISRMEKIVILRGDYECQPNTGRFWMWLIHFKNGLQDFEIEESRELEVMEDGGMTSDFCFSFADWKAVPDAEATLRRLAGEGQKALTKDMLRKLMGEMCRLAD